MNPIDLSFRVWDTNLVYSSAHTYFIIFVVSFGIEIIFSLTRDKWCSRKKKTFNGSVPNLSECEAV